MARKRKTAPKQQLMGFLAPTGPLDRVSFESQKSAYLGDAAQIGRLQFSAANINAVITLTNALNQLGAQLSMTAALHPEVFQEVQDTFARAQILLSGK